MGFSMPPIAPPPIETPGKIGTADPGPKQQPGGGIAQWAPVIGSVAGGLIDMWSQNKANAANSANVDKMNAFNAQQSATQYQRGVADIKAAGLNPALAYDKGGNSAASGGSAQAAPVTNNTAAKFASAMDVYNTLATGAAQRDLLREQATATNVSANNANADLQSKLPTVATNTNPEYVQAYTAARLAEARGQEFTANKTQERFGADIANVGAGTAQAQAAAAKNRADTTLAEQQFMTEAFRKTVMPWINDFNAGAGAASNGIGTAKDLMNIFTPKVPGVNINKTTTINHGPKP